MFAAVWIPLLACTVTGIAGYLIGYWSGLAVARQIDRDTISNIRHRLFTGMDTP